MIKCSVAVVGCGADLTLRSSYENFIELMVVIDAINAMFDLFTSTAFTGRRVTPRSVAHPAGCS
ncbi:hypothetical protein DBR24_11320 [Pseudomonas sp. HMWF006]|nr:hypothetical protein DBR24_11320 [Pseudomonas sp. HMWF006]PTT64710.1 hypothetical protein DBR26_20530 [Pseudomonas sp. HMWF007]PTT87514.1 hypothetical protein DBR29_19830 [Pseudomonas sp. HMWF005]